MAKVVKGSIAEALNTSQFSLFHIKAMFAAAMGFFYIGLRLVHNKYCPCANKR